MTSGKFSATTEMSAPTVLFVLERALRLGLYGPVVLSALGPGFTANFLALEAFYG